jgi:hypothetical protein
MIYEVKSQKLKFKIDNSLLLNFQPKKQLRYLLLNFNFKSEIRTEKHFTFYFSFFTFHFLILTF